MTKARDRSSRSGSDPIQIGSTKLVTNVSGYEGIIDIEGGNDSIIVITQE